MGPLKDATSGSSYPTVSALRAAPTKQTIKTSKTKQTSKQKSRSARMVSMLSGKTRFFFRFFFFTDYIMLDIAVKRCELLRERAFYKCMPLSSLLLCFIQSERLPTPHPPPAKLPCKQFNRERKIADTKESQRDILC